MRSCTWTHHVKKPFRLRATVISHGWCEVPPMEWDEAKQEFYTAERIGDDLYLICVKEKEITRTDVTLKAVAHGPQNTSSIKHELRQRVERILRLDAELKGFYAICRKEPLLRRIPKEGAGRILRGSDLFADLVKGICGTNIAWKQAVRMMHRLATLGPSHSLRPDLHAFPTAQEIVDAGLHFLTDEVRLGYRAEFIYTFAQQVVAGEFDVEELRAIEKDADSDSLAKAYMRVKGIGKTTANYLLSMAGHYDRLAIDSAVINYCRDHYFDGRKPAPKEVEKLFESYGKWRALVWWFELWQNYVENNPLGPV